MPVLRVNIEFLLWLHLLCLLYIKCEKSGMLSHVKSSTQFRMFLYPDTFVFTCSLLQCRIITHIRDSYYLKLTLYNWSIETWRIYSSWLLEVITHTRSQSSLYIDCVTPDWTDLELTNFADKFIYTHVSLLLILHELIFFYLFDTM